MSWAEKCTLDNARAQGVGRGLDSYHATRTNRGLAYHCGETGGTRRSITNEDEVGDDIRPLLSPVQQTLTHRLHTPMRRWRRRSLARSVDRFKSSTRRT